MSSSANFGTAAYKAAIATGVTGRVGAVAHNNLGAIYERQLMTEQARHEYEEAIRLDPTYEEARRNLRRLQGR